MKLAILSRGSRSYSTRRFMEAAQQRGHQADVLDTLKFAIDLQRGSPDLYYKQQALDHYDAVLPRIGASITYYGTAVVRQFQEMDAFCANTAHGITNSRDKLRSLQTRGWRVSSPAPAWILLARSSTTLQPRWIFPRSTYVSDSQSARAMG